ncbi:MAG TPA: hypothetical protein VF459_10105 [Caulobacteraceae bacterium]
MKLSFGAVALSVSLSLMATAAHADDAPVKSLRLIGETPPPKEAEGMDSDGKPGPARRFVIDATVKPGDGEFQSTLGGWFAGLDDNPPTGEIEGSCVEKHCAFTVSVEDGKMAFTGDLLNAAGPVTAHFTLKDEDDKVTSQGAVTLRPLAGPIAGLGALAAPDAIDAAAFSELLIWNHQSAPSGMRGGEPVDDMQREALADWQKSKGRTGTGLIFAADLVQLRADTAEAKKAAGWTALGDAGHGWSAGYPAALFPHADHDAGQPRFASADGKAALAFAIEAPMTDAAFDALVERETGDNPARSNVGYNRVNGDMDLHYEEKGVFHVLAWHNRGGALARMSLTYPQGAADTYDPFSTILTSSFVVSDDLRR